MKKPLVILLTLILLIMTGCSSPQPLTPTLHTSVDEYSGKKEVSASMKNTNSTNYWVSVSITKALGTSGYTLMAYYENTYRFSIHEMGITNQDKFLHLTSSNVDTSPYKSMSYFFLSEEQYEIFKEIVNSDITKVRFINYGNDALTYDMVYKESLFKFFDYIDSENNK